MAFERQTAIVPERVGHITIKLFDPDPQQPANAGVPALQRSAMAEIRVVMSDGSTRTVHANIADHFSTTVLNQLRNFVASVRTKANAEIL